MLNSNAETITFARLLHKESKGVQIGGCSPKGAFGSIGIACKVSLSGILTGPDSATTQDVGSKKEFICRTTSK